MGGVSYKKVKLQMSEHEMCFYFSPFHIKIHDVFNIMYST